MNGRCDHEVWLDVIFLFMSCLGLAISVWAFNFSPILGVNSVLSLLDIVLFYAIFFIMLRSLSCDIFSSESKLAIRFLLPLASFLLVLVFLIAKLEIS